MKRALLLALAACKASHAPARDDGVRGGDAAVAPAPPEPSVKKVALPDAERAALTGMIHASAGREGGFRIVAFDPTGKKAPETISPEGGASFFPVPGPANLALVTIDHGDEHTENLFLDGRPIGPRAGHVRSPVLTPDRTAVIFEADTQSFRDLYALDVKTEVLTRLTDTPAGNFEPSVSPDGTKIAFSSSRDGQSEIYVMPRAGGDATRLTTDLHDDWLPTWSPDGASIAFLTDREGTPRAYVMRADGSELRPAHDGDAAGEEQEPAWSPDGTKLLYSVSTRDGASEVWWADPAKRTASRVSAPGARDEVPSWAPDSAHVVYVSTRDQRIDLWIARADGTAETRLTDTPEEEWIPRWRP